MSGDLDREVVQVLARAPAALTLEDVVERVADAMGVALEQQARFVRDVHSVLHDLHVRDDVWCRSDTSWSLTEAGRARFAQALTGTGENRDQAAPAGHQVWEQMQEARARIDDVMRERIRGSADERLRQMLHLREQIDTLLAEDADS